MIYYTLQLFQYCILPFVAAIGLFGVCLSKIKRKCRRSTREEPSPFQKLVKNVPKSTNSPNKSGNAKQGGLNTSASVNDVSKLSGTS